MQKNKIVLASLMGLFSLNATASAWMPSKDNALVYAAGGLAVVTGVLAYKVCQLTKHVASLEVARGNLSLVMLNKAEACDVQEMARQIKQMQKSLDALEYLSEQNATSISSLATKGELAASLSTVFESIRTADNVCGKRFADIAKANKEQIDINGEAQRMLIEKYQQIFSTALQKQKEALAKGLTNAASAHKKALDELNKELTNTLAINDAARQQGIIEIQKKLKTFVLLERLDQALQPIKEAADKAKTDAALAKSEAEKGTRLSQSAKDEVRELGEQVRNLAKSIATNATAKADAEKPTDAPAAAAATPAAASANA